MTSAFDYQAPAELFHPLRMGRGAPVAFQRFATTAEAIKFAIESLPPQLLHGAVIEVSDERLDSAGMRELYDHASFPLGRRVG